jgi:hypothetical protein
MTFVFAMTGAMSADAGPTAAEKCQATKEKTAGKHGQCHAKVDSKGVSKGEAPDPLGLTKCDDKTTKLFGKAETKGGAECLTSGDVAGVSAALEACADDLTLLITDGNLPGGGGLGKCDSKKIKAAGKHLS